MAVVVIYDANVLYPSYQRSLLIEVARAGLVRARWTEQILDEVFRNLKKNRTDLNPAGLDRTRVLLNDAIRDVLVTGYEPLIEALDLPDPDDRNEGAGRPVLPVYRTEAEPVGAGRNSGRRCTGPERDSVARAGRRGPTRGSVVGVAAWWCQIR